MLHHNPGVAHQGHRCPQEGEGEKCGTKAATAEASHEARGLQLGAEEAAKRNEQGQPHTHDSAIDHVGLGLIEQIPSVHGNTHHACEHGHAIHAFREPNKLRVLLKLRLPHCLRSQVRTGWARAACSMALEEHLEPKWLRTQRALPLPAEFSPTHLYGTQPCSAGSSAVVGVPSPPPRSPPWSSCARAIGNCSLMAVSQMCGVRLGTPHVQCSSPTLTRQPKHSQ
mmetsp:Transcript_1472/g.3461  ORF Transcript_1472/g.3461 Transcript_1472/m.3461 type:complete len:225 (-) Transcript_1472:1970-2644(-)